MTVGRWQHLLMSFGLTKVLVMKFVLLWLAEDMLLKGFEKKMMEDLLKGFLLKMMIGFLLNISQLMMGFL